MVRSISLVSRMACFRRLHISWAKFCFLFIPVLLLFGTGCTCLPRSVPLNQYQFTIYRPTEVKVYRPVAGTPPSPDTVYAYLRIENTGPQKTPLSFGRWDKKKKEWKPLFGSLEPAVRVTSRDAPVLEVEPILTGLANQNICPGRIFPKSGPAEGDFPQNEYSFRRDFALAITPDRAQIGKRGYLEVEVFLKRIGKSVDGENSLVSRFRLPVSITNEFRPDSLLTNPALPH